MPHPKLRGSKKSAMALIRVKGIKTYRSRGRLYVYHRASGTRLKSLPGSSEFFAELAAIKSNGKPEEKPGTWGALVTAYRASPRFLIELKPRTRKDYNRVLDWMVGLDEMPLDNWSRAFIVQLRDKAQQEKGRRFGNYILSVVSVVFSWGLDRGEVEQNPGARIKKIRRPKGEPRQNRPWSKAEWNAVLAVASKHLRPALLLWGLLGWRKGETISALRSAYDRKTKALERVSAKSGKIVRTPAPKALIEALEAIYPHNAVTMLVSSRKRPWSEGGISAALRKLLAPLLKAGKIGSGLTPHGLRHTCATRLREAGYSLRTIADMLGQETEGMAGHYASEADMEKTLRGVVKTMDRKARRKR